MYPSLARRQFPSGSGANKFMGSGGPAGRNNVMLGVAALVGLTGLVYWWGYNDVDKRHRNDGSRKEGVIGEIIPQL
ncbi:hypothetical protein Hypma_013958 [Hypsizygus marmoreus]|uniref:Uncharacterized protein n=1 Tax=Hypsizygus marmoreus TaxID=39966 RepID=A0A369K5H2_HYPMA|nr:hypothetical protein Hypma_013958 [Hypsizygus marmoreus]